MPFSIDKKKWYMGGALAILATIIWSGNFVIARGVHTSIGPFSLAFYRWMVAVIILLPFSLKKISAERKIIQRHLPYLFWTCLTGIAFFNTFIYIAGHHTSAINMALIGTTSSPIFATILAAIFLKERLHTLRITGMIICIAGILLLLSNGSIQKLAGFEFSVGDLWVLAGAISFAVYNVLVRKKAKEISAITFLFVLFAMGALLLLPFFIVEQITSPSIHWSASLIISILYLGAGTSVIAFLCWNAAIQRMGASKTALFGNLIPVFSTLEAVWLLGEKMTVLHVWSGGLVIIGLIIANRPQTTSRNL